MDTKVCSKCGRELEINMFRENKKMKDGYRSECGMCEKDYTKKYREQNKIGIKQKREEAKDYSKKYREENKEKAKDYSKKYREENKEKKKKNDKKYYENNKQHCAELMKQYRTDNKDKLVEIKKLYYEDNKQHFTELSKQYRIDNKDKLVKIYKIYYEDNKTVINKKNKKYRENNKESIAKNKRQYAQDNKESIAKYMCQYGKKYTEKNKEKISIRMSNYNKQNRDIKNIATQRYRAKRKGLAHTFNTKQWESAKLYFNNSCAYCGKELPLAREHFIAQSKNGEYTVNNIIPSCGSCNSSKLNRDFFVWYPKYRYYSKKREKAILEFLNYKNGNQQITLII